MALPSDAPTIERPHHAERHTDTTGHQRDGGIAASQPGEAGDPFGAHDAAGDFAPEGGPAVSGFREWRAPDTPESGPAPGSGPRAAETGTENWAYNEDGTPRYNKDGTRQRKRGRQTGSKTGPRKTAPLRVSGIESLLLSTHGMLAAITQFEDFALEEKEAKDLATNIAAVAEHYPMLEMSDKDRAWLALGATAAMIYGPRAFLAFKAAQRRKAERARDVKRPPDFDAPGAGSPVPSVVAVAKPPAPKSSPAANGRSGFPAFVPDN